MILAQQAERFSDLTLLLRLFVAEMLGRVLWVLLSLSPVGGVGLDGWLQAPWVQIAGVSGLLPAGI